MSNVIAFLESLGRDAALAPSTEGFADAVCNAGLGDDARAALLAGDWSADQRMAAFLVGVSRRLAARGFSSSRFQLTMPRTDIANYLRLAPETVSRVLRRMQDDGLLAVERRDVCLLDRARIEALSAPILRE